MVARGPRLSSHYRSRPEPVVAARVASWPMPGLLTRLDLRAATGDLSLLLPGPRPWREAR